MLGIFTNLIDQIKSSEVNSAKVWDEIWKKEGKGTWRKGALDLVYKHIAGTVESKKTVCDIGGGVGVLADLLAQEKQADVLVLDHSDGALLLASENKHRTKCVDLCNDFNIEPCDYVTCTEVLEHFPENIRSEILQQAAKASKLGAFFSVPNNLLGPEEEPQHVIKFTAISFKQEIAKYFKDFYICVICKGFKISSFSRGYLLAVCGEIAKKPYKLSVTMPVRDESDDLERTLASLCGISDELVIGIDPRTKDNSEEIAKWYADKVFHIKDPSGPPEEYQGEDGMHFSNGRNQCIEHCTGDWIFMTEGHEPVIEGFNILRKLDQIPNYAQYAFVYREDPTKQWMYPWLFKNLPGTNKYTRAVHNILDVADDIPYILIPGIRTYHERSRDRAESRHKQRVKQNRKSLFDDWLTRGSEASLFYYAQEIKETDPDRAIARYEQFLAINHNGPHKYQVRLTLAKAYIDKGDKKKAQEILLGAFADDWCRTEHCVWLGDIAFMSEEYEKAYQFYKFASTSISRPPLSIWWIAKDYYRELPAQRLAIVCSEIGMFDEALMWAKKALELLPEDSPEEMKSEAENNVHLVEEALAHKQKVTV